MKNIKLPTLVSNVDNCVVYNMLNIKQSDLSAKDIMLLQSFRNQAAQSQTLSYYKRAAPIVKRIRQRADAYFVWLSFYNDFGKEFLDLLRQGQSEDAITQIDLLLRHAEQYF